MGHYDKIVTAKHWGVAASFAAAISAAPRASAQNEPPSGAKPLVVDAEPVHEERTANNAVYVEGLGPALLYSINYDRTFGVVSGRVGFEYISIGSTSPNGSSASVTFLGIPITASYLGIGSLRHMFEVGGGASIYYFGGSVNTLSNRTSGSAVTAVGTVLAGYRYQPPGGGFFLRAGLSPIFIFATGTILPWPYLALGATF
ncbi:MAG: hypothetical protein M3O50_22650 [Myxococcota bacterium]|nr:hypothetical protein [Myxococcota bacterium]